MPSLVYLFILCSLGSFLGVLFWLPPICESAARVFSRFVSASAFPRVPKSCCSAFGVKLTNRMWFSVVCSLIDKYALSQWSKFCGLKTRRRVTPPEILTTVMTCIVIDNSTDHAKPHFDLFLLPQYQHQNGFFSERVLNMALRDTLTRAAFSGLLSSTEN